MCCTDLRNCVTCCALSDSLGKAHADREEGGGKENDVKDPLLGGLEQHGGDVNRVGRN